MQNSNNQNKQIAMLGADKYKMSARDVVLPYAIASWQKQAGYVAPKMPVSSASMSQRETQLYCTDAAANYLRDMIEGTHTPAIFEWVIGVSKVGQLAPPEYLPTLLELGKEDKHIRPYIVSVGGNRILWVAEHVDSRTARWVTKIAGYMPDYLQESYIQICELDAALIGSLIYQIKHSQSKYIDNKPDEIRRTGRLKGTSSLWYAELGLFDLCATKGIWSPPLSEAFMEGAYVDCFYGIDSSQFAYKLSLQIEQKRLQAWQNVMCRRFQKSSEVFQQTMPIIEYRRNMRQAIEAK